MEVLVARFRVVAIDFDIGSARSEPVVARVEEAIGWIRNAFAAAGASPMVARACTVLEAAGLTDVTMFGVQEYWPPRSPKGPTMIAGVVRRLAEAIVAHRIATREQIGLDTLEQRTADSLTSANAVLLPPTVSGAWGTRSST